MLRNIFQYNTYHAVTRLSCKSFQPHLVDRPHYWNCLLLGQSKTEDVDKQGICIEM